MGRRLRGRRKPYHVRESGSPLSDVSSISVGAHQKPSDSQVSSLSPSDNFVSLEDEKCPTSSTSLAEPCDRLPRLQPISSFSTVTGFSGDILPSGVSSGTSGGNVISNSSVIEILVHLLCREREPDHTRRALLFKALCNGIKTWNNSLYLPLHAFPELQDFRADLLKKFEFLFEKVQSQITSDPSKLIIPSSQLPNAGSPLTQLALTDTYQNQFLDDRYSREFTELSVLGKGGFGVVVKARNKLDGCKYAVKIIIMDKPNSETSNKLLREVQALAQLNHPNIVRYHSTWLQLFTVPPHLWPKYHSTRAFKKQELRQRNIQKHKISVYVPSPPQVHIQELSSSSDPDDWEESSGGIVFADVSRNKSPLSNKFDIIAENGESSYESNADKALSQEKDNSSPKTVLNDNNLIKSDLRWSFVAKNSVSSSFVKSEFSRSHVETERSCSSNTKGTSSVAALENSVCKVSSSYAFASSSSSSNHLNKKSVILYGQHPDDTKMTLFIQMGLCGDTLADWISKRNNSPAVQGNDSVNGNVCLGIFRQILLAVQYIHSKNIIHRDLKPQNIFFTEDGSQIQLGDFGLARSLPAASPSKNEVDPSLQNLCLTPILNPTPNTGGVGTPIYAAPELRYGGNYGSESDLHNLGVILLELFHPFQTGSERVHVINDLKTRQYLEPEFFVRWPDIAPLILNLTSPDPSKRPTASELLNLKLFNAEMLHCPGGENNEVEASSIKVMEETIDLQSFEAPELLNQFGGITIDETDVVANEARPAFRKSQMFMHLQQANKEKDERIKILSNENVMLREMVAKLERRISQIGAVEQQ